MSASASGSRSGFYVEWLEPPWAGLRQPWPKSLIVSGGTDVGSHVLVRNSRRGKRVYKAKVVLHDELTSELTAEADVGRKSIKLEPADAADDAAPSPAVSQSRSGSGGGRRAAGKRVSVKREPGTAADAPLPKVRATASGRPRITKITPPPAAEELPKKTRKSAAGDTNATAKSQRSSKAKAKMEADDVDKERSSSEESASDASDDDDDSEESGADSEESAHRRTVTPRRRKADQASKSKTKDWLAAYSAYARRLDTFMDLSDKQQRQVLRRSFAVSSSGACIACNKRFTSVNGFLPHVRDCVAMTVHGGATCGAGVPPDTAVFQDYYGGIDTFVALHQPSAYALAERALADGSLRCLAGDKCCLLRDYAFWPGGAAAFTAALMSDADSAVRHLEICAFHEGHTDAQDIAAYAAYQDRLDELRDMPDAAWRAVVMGFGRAAKSSFATRLAQSQSRQAGGEPDDAVRLPCLSSACRKQMSSPMKLVSHVAKCGMEKTTAAAVGMGADVVPGAVSVQPLRTPPRQAHTEPGAASDSIGPPPSAERRPPPLTAQRRKQYLDTLGQFIGPTAQWLCAVPQCGQPVLYDDMPSHMRLVHADRVGHLDAALGHLLVYESFRGNVEPWRLLPAPVQNKLTKLCWEQVRCGAPAFAMTCLVEGCEKRLGTLFGLDYHLRKCSGPHAKEKKPRQRVCQRCGEIIAAGGKREHDAQCPERESMEQQSPKPKTTAGTSAKKKKKKWDDFTYRKGFFAEVLRQNQSLSSSAPEVGSVALLASATQPATLESLCDKLPLTLSVHLKLSAEQEKAECLQALSVAKTDAGACIFAGGPVTSLSTASVGDGDGGGGGTLVACATAPSVYYVVEERPAGEENVERDGALATVQVWLVRGTDVSLYWAACPPDAGVITHVQFAPASDAQAAIRQLAVATTSRMLHIYYIDVSDRKSAGDALFLLCDEPTASLEAVAPLVRTVCNDAGDKLASVTAHGVLQVWNRSGGVWQSQSSMSNVEEGAWRGAVQSVAWHKAGGGDDRLYVTTDNKEFEAVSCTTGAALGHWDSDRFQMEIRTMPSALNDDDKTVVFEQHNGTMLPALVPTVVEATSGKSLARIFDPQVMPTGATEVQCRPRGGCAAAVTSDGLCLLTAHAELCADKTVGRHYESMVGVRLQAVHRVHTESTENVIVVGAEPDYSYCVDNYELHAAFLPATDEPPADESGVKAKLRLGVRFPCESMHACAWAGDDLLAIGGQAGFVFVLRVDKLVQPVKDDSVVAE